MLLTVIYSWIIYNGNKFEEQSVITGRTKVVKTVPATLSSTCLSPSSEYLAKSKESNVCILDVRAEKDCERE